MGSLHAPWSDAGSPESAPSGGGTPSTRVVVLCCDGLYQRWLVQRASQMFDLVGVELQHPPAPARQGRLARLKRYRDPSVLLRQIQARRALPPFERLGRALQDRLFRPQGKEPSIPPSVPLLHTDAINGPETVAFLERLAPDLVLVNGTQLLREPVLALKPLLRHGIVNLHTGLSPYSRGANCNLYMILEGHPELVGVTVHHIDPGIDSGDIIRSAQVPLEPGDNFETIDVRSFHVGIELLLAGARELVAGRAARVPQWEKGKLFLQRTGYRYEPWQRLEANRRLEGGLLAEYLADREARDAAVRLVGATGGQG